jgi:phosphatidylserine decarboxylase
MRIDPAGVPFLAVLGGATVLLFVVVDPLAAVPSAGLLVFTAWFFRDPERVDPDEPMALVSPADGRIIKATRDEISVFMNVFDVHVCRAPTEGEVVAVRHEPGRFLAAYRDAAPTQNERVEIVLQDAERGETRFTLIAGLVARRIVPRVAPGQRLERGQRVGLIRFGSRVDLRLPRGTAPRVTIGDRVVAGETVVAGPEDGDASSGSGWTA